ncbi:MAG: serine/threonine-protein kinase, partial [Mariniblastus sp.]|nr:serine/threonine-protein kinase [Mariniblastus sp.]
MKFSYPSGAKPLEGYTIKRGIGIGGFGEVYFALSDAGKEVALKKIQRNLDVELRGVRQCLNLKHVNLISLWDIKISEFGESWVVMEYVPGPSLRDTVEAHPSGMPIEQIKAWFSSTASGVAYLHEHGIVHRDLKPGNIFCDQDEQVIKIGDYGLSKFISCSRRSGQTESVGTFHYMAPEIGKGVYGKEIDIYALGIILFEMLTGDVPFDGESTQEIIMKHLTSDPDVSLAPDEYRSVLAKSLRKDPELRFNSVQEMVADLPWPEIAAKSHDIISKHAVGPMAGTKRLGEGVLGGPVATPENPISKQVNPSQLPPAIIDNDAVEVVEEIVFGPLRDSNRQANEVRRIQANSKLRDVVTGAPKADSIKVVRQRTTAPVKTDLSLVKSSGNSAASWEGEPIANAVQFGFAGVSRWWNHANFSTPIKIGLLITGGIVIVQNSTWLLPLVLAVGVVYAFYFIGRTWFCNQGTANGPSPQELNRQTILAVRNHISQRPSIDRMTELIGSLLVASFACIVLNLLGLAFSGEVLNESIEPWARFAWLTVTSIVATWALLICSKSWEHRSGDPWARRFVMIGVGLAIGLFTFFSAGSLSLDLSRMAFEDFQARRTDEFVMQGVPLLPGYLIFFGVLFGILRWWRQADPVRKTRLSMLNVLICLIWATLFSHLLNLPLTSNCIIAVVISVSAQLASPWFHPDSREEICAESQSESIS